jgi:Heterokaryon incompatibility protein (HET)
LSCSLNQVSLLKAPPFVALSYCWGDLNEKIRMMVNDLEVFVTVNLYAALRRLRAERIECVWVDFLCINQENSEERSLQIRRMGTIYNEAKQVAVWLGDEQDIEEHNISTLSAEGAKIAHKALSFSARRAFIQLLSRPYWTRIWIIQELAAASSIIVLCGRHKLSWEIFSNDSHTEFVAPIDETASNEFETRFQNICHFRTDRRDGNPIRLLEALYRSQSALSTDPRDKIYALLGLVFDSHRFVPEPNYNLSKEETYTNFSLALIKHRLPLDFIYLRTSNRRTNDSLPSWVVDWSDLNDALARQEFRHIMESVLPGFSTTHFNEQNQPHALGSTLMIRGSIHGIIDSLSSAFCTGESDSATHFVLSPGKGAGSAQPNFDCSSYIFNALLESRRLSAAGIMPPPSPIRLWSSITRTKLGVLFDGSMLPTETERLLDWFDECRSLAAFGRTMEYWDSTWTSRPSDTDWSPQQTACLRSLVRTIMSDMRIAIFETGELGWVHPQSRKGDKVAKIFGCDRHVVLRPHSRGYRVIGEARPYWLAGKPELSDNTESLAIF